MSKADERHDITVDQYIESLDENTRDDAIVLMKMMQKISGEEPILYGYGTIGYGVYKYEYSSGRKGEAHTIAFYPRKGKTTVYLMDGTTRYADELSRLGKHSTTGYCIYVKQLSDINMKILEDIIKESFNNISELSKKGPIDRVLWQS